MNGSDTARDWVWTLAVFLVLAAAFPYFEATRNANERPRLLQAMALVEDGEWAIDGAVAGSYAAGPDVARSPVDDRLYPNKPPGATLVAVAAYEAAGIAGDPPTLRNLTAWARVLGGIVPVAFMFGLIWRRCGREWGRGPALAAATWLVFCTPMFSYARLFYGHALAALALYAGIGVLVDARELRWKALLGGALAGAAVAIEYGAAFVGLPIGIWLLVRAVRTKELAIPGFALLGALLPIAGLALYHQQIFGSAFSTGYHHVIDPEFAAKHGEGLLGLRGPRLESVWIHVFAPATGILWWAPLLPIALWGLWKVGREKGPMQLEARLHIAVFATILALGLSLSFEGGWRVGPRYLVAVLPSAALGLAYLCGRPMTRWLRIAIFALVTWSAVLNALAASWWPHIDPTAVTNPIGELLLPLLRDGFVPYGPFGVELPGSVLGVIVFVLPPLALSFITCSRGMPCPAHWNRDFAGVGFGLALVAAAAALLPSHPRGARNLAYVEKVYEPRPDPSS